MNISLEQLKRNKAFIEEAIVCHKDSIIELQQMLKEMEDALLIVNNEIERVSSGALRQ